jgi:hypothetical protein
VFIFSLVGVSHKYHVFAQSYSYYCLHAPFPCASVACGQRVLTPFWILHSHDLTETTRDMIKRGTEDLKQLSILQSNLPHQQSLLKKTSHDFQLAVAAFQNVQRMSAERQRTVVEVVKQTAAAEESGADGAAARPASPSLQQTQMQIQCVSLSYLLVLLLISGVVNCPLKS